MENSAKFFLITCVSALILVMFLMAGFSWQKFNWLGNNYADFILPSNSEKIANGASGGSQIVRLLFVGDIMLDRHVKEKIKGNDPAYLFQGLKNAKFDFNKYDLINANLEGAVTNGGAHYPPVYSYDFAFAPELVARLKDYNFKAFNLANNHLTDQGERGAAETQSNLAKLDFLSYGCADAQAGDCSFKIYQAGGLKIGLAGFSQIYKKIDLEKVKKIIADLSGQTDLVIVNAHWGAEYEHIFNKVQQDLAHKLIDAGVDLIIGHHPHVVQGLEIYRDKLIFYSLGNFIFDQYFSRDTQEELAVEVNVTDFGKVKVVLYPLISQQSQSSLMTGGEREKYLAKIAGWSRGDKDLIGQIKKGEIIINF